MYIYEESDFEVRQFRPCTFLNLYFIISPITMVIENLKNNIIISLSSHIFHCAHSLPLSLMLLQQMMSKCLPERIYFITAKYRRYRTDQNRLCFTLLAFAQYFALHRIDVLEKDIEKTTGDTKQRRYISLWSILHRQMEENLRHKSSQIHTLKKVFSK